MYHLTKINELAESKCQGEIQQFPFPVACTFAFCCLFQYFVEWVKEHDMNRCFYGWNTTKVS